jgi:hypothetical protein
MSKLVVFGRMRHELNAYISCIYSEMLATSLFWRFCTNGKIELRLHEAEVQFLAFVVITRKDANSVPFSSARVASGADQSI